MASSLPPHVPLSLLMTKDDFDCPEVLNAVNPHPVSGYAHGMTPNHNKNIILLCANNIIIRPHPKQQPWMDPPARR
jgi:hypothetical protein